MARQFQMKTLSVRVATLCAITSMTAFAETRTNPLPGVPFVPNGLRTVSNCDDSGPGSLRDVVGSAVSGDIIDLTQLACSEITLISGKVAITVPDLMLLGPGVGAGANHHLAINGWYDRVLDHGTGTLILSGLKLAYGHYQGDLARGGCILSRGTLFIDDSIVSACEVDAPYGSIASFAGGGAIYTQGELWMQNSVVSNSTAYSATQVAYGGGVFASYGVTIEGSTITGNRVIAPQALAVGGGLMVGGFSDVTIMSSTISGNEAEFAGGMRIDTLGTSKIINSTLSGNYASLYIGGASFSNTTVSLINSTIARNSTYAYAAGVYSDLPMTVQSSIVADNRAIASDSIDVCAPSIGGGANLITSSCSTTPGDTIRWCPRLTALADHGGPTWTHALVPGGLGFNVGSNTMSLDADQRGYARAVGPGIDIGAYEWQGDFGDNIFKSAFEIACDEY